MPTFEVVSVACRPGWSLQTPVGFDAIFERELVSHRGLFKDVYSELTGAIAHLGNLGMARMDAGFWANELFQIDSDDSTVVLSRVENSWFPYSEESLGLRVNPSLRDELSHVFECLLEVSSAELLTVATDYQFGGPALVRSFDSLRAFWQYHDSGAMFFNTLAVIGPPSAGRERLESLGVAACRASARTNAAQQTAED